MLTTGIITLLSSLGGGFLRLLPEILAHFKSRQDNDHEYRMQQLVLEAARVQGAEERATLALQGDFQIQGQELALQAEALKGQFQLTGVRWLDAANVGVRPLTTYYFLAWYGMVKAATLGIALRQLDAWTAILSCWSDWDAATLSGILSFYFVGRVFDKRRAQ